MATPGVRAENRARLSAEIVRLGREQLAEVGPAALSLRAIARDLGLSSSAVYRYVASRDELLTLLIVESFNALGETAEMAEEAAPREDFRARFLAVGGAVRAWGLAHPFDWALLYGSPVPGYAAPASRTNTAGTRVQRLLLTLLREAAAARRTVRPAQLASTQQAVGVAESLLAETGLTPAQLSPALFLAAVDAWTLMIAAVSREVFDQLGPIPGDPAALYANTLDRAASMILKA